MTPEEMTSARAIRATLDSAGRLTDPTAFRAACRASREKHGEVRHETVKCAAVHMRSDQ